MYSDVSRRIFDYLVHEQVDHDKSVRWNVMRKWIDASADRCARVTKASRQFMRAGHAPFLQQLQATIATTNPDFRNILFPKQTKAFFELLITSHVCETLDDPHDLTLWNMDGFVCIEKLNFANVTFHPRSCGVDPCHTGRRFVASISPHIISKRFLEVELKHAATNPVLMIVTKSRLEIVRRGSLLACIPFCNVHLDSDGERGAFQSVDTTRIDHIRQMCGIGRAHELVRMQHDPQLRLRHTADGIDGVRELTFDQVRRFLLPIGVSVSIPDLHNQHHLVSTRAARAAFQWLDLPIHVTSSSSVRGGGRMWPRRMRGKRKNGIYAQGKDAMGILTHMSDSRSLMWVRYIPSDACVKMLALHRC